MTTATVETARDVEVFRHQAGVIHEVLRMNVAGLTQEESLIQPSPGVICRNWTVGHVLSVYHATLPMLGQEPVMGKEALKRYGRGTPPLRDPGEALDLQELLTAWTEATRRIDAGLASLTPEALDRPAPF